MIDAAEREFEESAKRAALRREAGARRPGGTVETAAGVAAAAAAAGLAGAKAEAPGGRPRFPSRRGGEAGAVPAGRGEARTRRGRFGLARAAAGGDRSRQARSVVRRGAARRSRTPRRPCWTGSGTTPRPSSTSPRPTRKWATSKAPARSCRKCCTRATTSRRRKRSRCWRSSPDRTEPVNARAAERTSAARFVRTRDRHPPMRIALGLEYCGTAFTGWQSQPRRARRAGRARARARGDRRSARRHDRRGPHRRRRARDDAGRPLRRRRGAPGSRPGCAASTRICPRTSRCCGRSPVGDEFHARYRARVARHYTYLLANRAGAPGAPRRTRRLVPSAARRRARCARPPARSSGTHDFSAFRAAECQAKSPVEDARAGRDRARAATSSVSTSRANAFLHHMIRNIVGALVYVGAGKAAADVDRRAARRPRPHARRADVRAGRALLHRRRLRREVGAAADAAAGRPAARAERAADHARTRVKICGITRVADGLAAAQRGRRRDRLRVLAGNAARRRRRRGARDRRARCRRS